MDSLKIKSIEINKFRSLNKIKCDLSDISVFVGQNDSGKSNILKALNLFFNNEVELGKKLVFKEDFSYNGHINKKADEIAIKLIFSLPNNYHSRNGTFLVWEKRWRQDAEFQFDKESDYFYGLRENGEKVDITSKSNVRSLMKRINYIYVPAIRDMNYFDNLRLRIYNTMTKVAESSLAQASDTFEKSISQYLLDLVNATKEQLGEDIVMSFPKNLADIFEKLDFLSGKNKVSLNKRGDGIKSRYIPLILNFIAVNEKNLTGRGAAPYTFIWGYEEPENNMEISNCIELCNEFPQYIQEAVSQIILTTHSPVFYNIKNKLEDKSSICLRYIKKTDDGTELNAEYDNIDEDMGTAAMMSEAYRQLEEKLKEAKHKQVEIEKLLSANHKSCLFVEGSTDKYIIERLLDIYKISHNFIIQERGAGCGKNYVIDMLQAWDLKEKFEQQRYRAAGLVDEDAKQMARDYNQRKNQRNITKCFVLSPSPIVKRWKLKNQYNVMADLESFFPELVWKKAKEKGWLIPRKPSEILNNSTIEDCLNDNKSKEDLLRDIPLFISYQVDPMKKGNFSKMISKLEDKDLEECFLGIKSQLEEIASYLEGN